MGDGHSRALGERASGAISRRRPRHARPRSRRSSCGAPPRWRSSRSKGSTGSAVACYRIWIGAGVVTVVFLATGGRITRQLICALGARRADLHRRPGALLLRGAGSRASPTRRSSARSSPCSSSRWPARCSVSGRDVAEIGVGRGGGRGHGHRGPRWRRRRRQQPPRRPPRRRRALFAWTAYFVCTKTARQPPHGVRVPHRHVDRVGHRGPAAPPARRRHASGRPMRTAGSSSSTSRSSTGCSATS